VAQGQEQGQPAIAAGKRLEPVAEVNSHTHDLGGAGPPVFDNNLLPRILFRVEPVQTFVTVATSASCVV
jgi:hypothetical protein